MESITTSPSDWRTQLAPSKLLVLCLFAFTIMSCDLNAQSTHEATHTAYSELTWGPTPFGPDAASVDGDFSAGAHVTYIRFTDGMVTPLHIHSASYVGLVLKGSTRHWLPGFPETEKVLAEGSHWFIPANAEHVSECLPGSECVMAIIQSSAMDFIAQEDN